jgi:two-component system LytT family response regulator
MPHKIKYRTIIADDEQLARERLKMLLEPYSIQIELIGEAENGIQCKKMIDDLKPDLLFLDIQMPGLNGFEVLQQVAHSPLVIFCTAHDEYALKAFETQSIDYIVKPFKAERVQKSIEKLELLKQQTNKHELLRAIEELTKLTPKKEITTIPVKIGDRMLILKIEEISYFMADEKYVCIFTVNGKKYLSDYSIKDLAQKIGDKFVRIQRAVLVNSLLIKEINKHSNSRYIIRMNDINGSKLISGRNYCEQVRKFMEL